MKLSPLLSALLVSAALLPSGDMKVFPTPNVDYSKYRTFTISPPRLSTRQGIIDNDDVVIPAIRAALARELRAKGLAEVSSGGDIMVQSAGLSGGTVTVDALIMTWGVDFYYGYAGPTSYTPIQRYNKEGTLAVGLVDARTKKGLWVAFDTEGIGGRGRSPEEVVDKAAARIFKKFPPKK
jgi:hypothetical protein